VVGEFGCLVSKGVWPITGGDWFANAGLVVMGICEGLRGLLAGNGLLAIGLVIGMVDGVLGVDGVRLPTDGCSMEHGFTSGVDNNWFVSLRVIMLGFF